MRILIQYNFWAISGGEIFLRKCCQAPVLGLGLGVDFTFAWGENKNNDKNPHLNFLEMNSARG